MIIANMDSKMNTDKEQLLKIHTAVKQMVDNGESQDYIDNFLQSQNETPATIKAINEYGIDNLVNARKGQEELRAKQQSTPEQLKKVGQIAGSALQGGLMGTLTGGERLLDATTLGGYGWLNKKIGGNYEERQEEQQKLAEEAGWAAGKANKLGNFMIDVGGAIKSPIYKVLPSMAGAQTKLGVIGRGALQGAVGSGVYNAFKNDSLEGVPRAAGIGAVVGGSIPALIMGAQGATKYITGTTTGKGVEPIKTAYSAGQRGSKAFKEGAEMTADDVVKIAQDGRDAIQKSASKAINEGKNAIGKNLVDKEGLFKELRDFYKNKFLYNGVDLASKGERHVLNEADKIIEKLSKGKMDVKTLDVIKQQLYKIVPESSNDRAALALRDALYGKVSQYLNKAAPEYAAIMKPYETAMKELSQVAEKTGVNRSGTKISTAINRLVKASRNPETQGIVKKLGGQDLLDRLAGYDLKALIPDTTIGRALATGLGGVAVGGGGASTLVGLPLMSPKLMGNTAYRLGQLSNWAPSVENIDRAINYLRMK